MDSNNPFAPNNSLGPSTLRFDDGFDHDPDAALDEAVGGADPGVSDDEETRAIQAILAQNTAAMRAHRIAQRATMGIPPALPHPLTPSSAPMTPAPMAPPPAALAQLAALVRDATASRMVYQQLRGQVLALLGETGQPADVRQFVLLMLGE